MTSNFFLTIFTLSGSILSASSIIAFLLGGLSAGGAAFLYRYLKRMRFRAVHSLAESILDESDQLNILINTIPHGVYIKDSSQRYILCNRVFAKHARLDNPQQIAGKTDKDICKEDEAEDYAKEDQTILEGTVPSITTKREIVGNGKKEILSVSKNPIKNKNGKIIGLVCLQTDITEQEEFSRQLEEQNKMLEKERTLFKALMDNMPDTIYIKDTECRFLDGNPFQVNVTKAGTHENLLGKTDFDFYPRDIAEIFYKDDKHVLETGKPVIKQLRGFA